MHGMKRIETSPTQRINEFLKKVMEIFELPASGWTIFMDRNLTIEMQCDDPQFQMIEAFNLTNGDILYLKIRSDVRAALEKVTCEDERKKRTLSMKNSFVIKDSITTYNRDITGTIIEDEVDQFLSKLDGKIPRERNEQLTCHHGDQEQCLLCVPYEPFDEEYLASIDPPIKCLSFHSYIRKRTGGLDQGKCVQLKNLSCKIKPGCRDHLPWPRGICSKCQPVSVILEKQSYRHVDFVQFENHYIVDRFLSYWRKTGSQRLGFLYGRYEYHNDVPLGIKAIVSAIYEPMQVSSENSIELVQDEHEVVNDIAMKFGLYEVGWIFTDLVPLDISRGNSQFLNAEECIMAANLQNRHPNPCRMSPEGHFGSKFVTVLVTGDVNGYEMHGFQVSEQLVALVRDNCLVLSQESKEFTIKESSSGQYVPTIFCKIGDTGEDIKLTQSVNVENMTVSIAVDCGLGDVPCTFFASEEIWPFPVKNRESAGEEQDLETFYRYICQSNNHATDLYYDLHLLCYMKTSCVFALESTFDELMLALKTNDETLFNQWRLTFDWGSVEDVVAGQRNLSETAVDNSQLYIPGNPYLILVGGNVPQGHITADGDGLRKGIIGQMATFQIKVADNSSAVGIIRISVNGPCEIEISCQEKEDGFLVMYCPHQPGTYFVCIEFGNCQIEGSPYQVQVMDSGNQLSTSSDEEENYSDQICQICKEIIHEDQWWRTLICRHTFHYICLYKWTLVKSVCPLCRKEIVNQR